MCVGKWGELRFGGGRRGNISEKLCVGKWGALRGNISEKEEREI
jgi:hypothetical protein